MRIAMRVLCVGLSFSIWSVAQEEEKIRSLVTRLEDPDGPARECAERDLAAIVVGSEDERVEALLRSSLDDAGPEGRMRIERLLDLVRSGERCVVIEDELGGAFNVVTGRYLWRRTSSTWVFRDRLETARGTLVFLGYLRDSWSGGFECRELRTGKVVWRDDGFSARAFAEGMWIGSQDGSIVARSPLDGRVVWTHSPEDPIQWHDWFDWQVDAERVYVRTRIRFHALDLKDGKSLWTLPHGASVLVVDGGVTILEGREPDQILRRLDGATGQVTWERAADDLLLLPSEGRTEAVVFVKGPHAGWERDLVALDARTGEELWRADAGDRVRVSADGTRVLVASGGIGGRRLFDHDLGTGRVLRELAASHDRSHDLRLLEGVGDLVVSICAPVEYRQCGAGFEVEDWDGEVLTFEDANHEPRWRARLELDQQHEFRVDRAGEFLVVIADESILFVFDARTGELAHRWNLRIVR